MDKNGKFDEIKIKINIIKIQFRLLPIIHQKAFS